MATLGSLPEQGRESTMLTTILPKRRLAGLLGALVVVGTFAVFAVPTASAQGRTLVGEFGFSSIAPLNCKDTQHFSINLTEDGQLVSSLRPGTYWLTVTDGCSNHNFELRSCPDSMSACDQNSGGTEQQITGVAEMPGTVTTKIHLEHGTYRLFCDALTSGGVSHEAAFSMYTDFAVGGVGQVG